jgi:hypothetical protein
MRSRQKQNSDHVHKYNTPTIDNEAISRQLEALLTPAIFAQQQYYKQLGLRDRILNLSFMVAAVLTLLWRQVFMVSCYQSGSTITLRKIFGISSRIV